jgi:hypothetical protein
MGGSFATNLKSLFTQNLDYILEITISLNWFLPYFFHVINVSFQVYFYLSM